MNNLKLKLTNMNSKFIPDIKIDGLYVKCKKNEFNSYEAVFQTDKTEVEIEISRNLELKSKIWWLYALVTFIVSVFGIFEPLYDRRAVVINVKYKVKLKEQSDIRIVFNNISTQGQAVKIETQDEVEELANEFYVDKQVKRRWIIMLILKILCWIGLIILGIFLLKKYI